MEKWKILVIVALLAVLPIFGYLQSNPGTAAIAPDQTQSPGASETPEPPTATSIAWVGKKSPGWTVAPTDWANTPKSLKVEDFRGKVLLLEFWRAECSHCQEAAPHIEKLSEEYSSRGLSVVGLQSPVTKEGVNEFDWPAVQLKAKQLGIKYPIGLDVGRKNFNLYKGAKFPTFVVIDRKGIVRYADHGFLPNKFSALTQELDKILAETPETTKQPNSLEKSAPVPPKS